MSTSVSSNPALFNLPSFVTGALEAFQARNRDQHLPSYRIMTHSYTLRFRILPSKPVLFLTTHSRIHSRTPSGPWNAKSHSISSTPKHSHINISENPTMRDLCNVDVLIVGAGPAGLMMASSLVRSGVSFRIIERRYAYDKLTLPHSSHSILFFGSNLPVRSALQQAGHGDGLQPRTMEVLQVRVV